MTSFGTYGSINNTKRGSINIEKSELTLEEFVNNAWEDTLTIFSEEHVEKESLFKQLFIKQIKDEFDHVKKMIEWANLEAKDNMCDSLVKNQMVDAYKNRKSIEITYSSVGNMPSGNLREALIESEISEDGIIIGWNDDFGISRSGASYQIKRVSLPLDYEFDLEKQKRR